MKNKTWSVPYYLYKFTKGRTNAAYKTMSQSWRFKNPDYIMSQVYK